PHLPSFTVKANNQGQNMKIRYPLSAVAVLFLLVLSSLSVSAQGTPVGTGFTYQGSLLDGDDPASGTYDFKFTLFEQATGGTVVGTPIEQENIVVSGGVFSTVLDFGNVF